MSDIREPYSISVDKAVTGDERYGMWEVFGYYGVRETDGDAIAVADRTVPKDVQPRKGPRSFDYKKRNGSSGRARRLNVVGYYMPLQEHPDLFERFARLPERGEIDRETWLGWLHQYGVLGVRNVLPGGPPGAQQNTVTDRFSRFVREAARANQSLRLFEAVTDPDRADIDAIQELLPEEDIGHVGDEPAELERIALWAIQDTIEQKVQADCHLHLVARDRWARRKKNMSPLAREWGFSSLLGAMWLQFMWLASADGIRRCKNPNCRRIITPYRRSDTLTCDAKCRKAYERSQRRRPPTVV